MNPSLRPGEQVIKIFRHYGLVYFWHWFFVFLFITAPFFFMFVLFSWGRGGVILFISFLVLSLLVFFRALFYWRRDCLIVTSERLIKIQQKGLLDKISTDLNYQNIRCATYQIKGLKQTLFRYGKIIVQTAEEKMNLEFKGVRKPALAVEIISYLLQKNLKETNQSLFNLSSLIGQISHFSKEDLRKIKEAVDKRMGELV